ncbi:hypothetical protein UB45_18795 [Terrabacter sp. 28]|nr:hypothetical protein UB45_18795 [Terrabacter sp. 28]
MADRDLDAEFERIIAGWDDEAPDPQRREASAPSPTDATAAEAPADEPSDTASDGADPTGSAVALDPSPAEAPPSASPDTTTPAGGRLELPIAPTTSHAWRGSTPRRDDADDLLDASDLDDDHFVPPSEIDLPSAETDPMFWAIVGGLVGGPLLLLYVLFFDRDGSGWWVATALAMVVVGFVLLVLRGGNERDPFDDGTRV